MIQTRTRRDNRWDGWWTIFGRRSIANRTRHKLSAGKNEHFRGGLFDPFLRKIQSNDSSWTISLTISSVSVIAATTTHCTSFFLVASRYENLIVCQLRSSTILRRKNYNRRTDDALSFVASVIRNIPFWTRSVFCFSWHRNDPSSVCRCCHQRTLLDLLTDFKCLQYSLPSVRCWCFQVQIGRAMLPMLRSFEKFGRPWWSRQATFTVFI